MRDRLIALHERLSSSVLGSEEASQYLLIALLAHGHVLIQGAPGIGKTSLAQLLARSLNGTCKRVQFTPDLLPADLLGFSLWQPQKGEFVFVPGPVFSNILLADEINRATPRLQSALLECMNEHQVTVDGVTRKLPPPFFVVATQNDLYSSGTFPLPEPQLDRFLMSLRLEPPGAEMMRQIVEYHAARPEPAAISPLMSVDDLARLQAEVRKITVSPQISAYIAALVHGAGKNESLRSMLSPRAALALLRASQSTAWLAGHPAVYADDVKKVAIPVLQHRLSNRESADSTGQAAKQWLEHLLKVVPAP